VTDLLSKGYTVEQLQKVGFSENSMIKGGVSEAEYQEAEVSIAAAAAASSAKGGSTTIVVAIVLVLLVVVGAMVYVNRSNAGSSGGGGSGGTTQHADVIAFENPMYATGRPPQQQQQQQQNKPGGGFNQDVQPNQQKNKKATQGQQAAYVDVSPSYQPPTDVNGYMDVPAASQTASGFDESSDEEV
jgi:hypothetical protein